MSKTCTKCNLNFSLSEFSNNLKCHDGKASWCRQCTRDSNNLRRRNNRVKSRQSEKNYKLKALYGITKDQYHQLLDDQYYQCPICFNSILPNERNTHVDHDHKTGKVRGILCGKCNVGLGHFNDNIVLFQNAIQYLQRNQ